jgi:hypothetical protein
VLLSHAYKKVRKEMLQGMLPKTPEKGGKVVLQGVLPTGYIQGCPDWIPL